MADEVKNVMKKVRIAVIVFFLISCVCFGLYRVRDWMENDQNAPQIQMDEDIIYVSAQASDEELLKGVTATDEEDGDLTDQIQVASLSPLMGKDERTVQYIVFDQAGQLAVASRTVVYTDYVPPRIYIKQPLRIDVSNYETELDSLTVAAVDMLDGDLTSRIKTSWGDVWYAESAGSYPFTLQVNNSAGDSCILEAELVLVDAAEEVGKYYPMLDDYVIYTQVGQSLKLKDYVWGISGDGVTYRFGDADIPEGISKDRISVHSEVDYTVPGTYKVEYSYTTRENVKAVSVMYVVVED